MISLKTSYPHVVFMISSVLCNQKPYALPVQCIPYAGLKETDIFRLVSALAKEMVSHGMNVAGKHFVSIPLCSELTIFAIGFVSNSEFNYLRTKGWVHTPTVLQIRTNVQNKYKNSHKLALLAMLTPKHKLQCGQIDGCNIFSFLMFIQSFLMALWWLSMTTQLSLQL